MEKVLKRIGYNIKASLTVEAGLVFPLFFYAVMALCCIFRYQYTEYSVEKSMLATARNLGQYPEIVKAAADKESEFAESLIGGLAGKKIPVTGLSVSEIAERASDSLVISGFFGRQIRNYPFACDTIVGGSGGISCLGSVLYTEKETILIKCSYSLKPPISLFGLGSVRKVQELEYRYFTGIGGESLLQEEDSEEENTDDTIVYITEEKVVYHKSLNCPSLNLVISACTLEEVPDKRNKGGGKYYKCERCARGRAPDIVYIAKDGDRYHYKRNCSGLKRTITEITLSEAEKTRRACKRCGK